MKTNKQLSSDLLKKLITHIIKTGKIDVSDAADIICTDRSKAKYSLEKLTKNGILSKIPRLCGKKRYYSIAPDIRYIITDIRNENTKIHVFSPQSKKCKTLSLASDGKRTVPGTNDKVLLKRIFELTENTNVIAHIILAQTDTKRIKDIPKNIPEFKNAPVKFLTPTDLIASYICSCASFERCAVLELSEDKIITSVVENEKVVISCDVSFAGEDFSHRTKAICKSAEISYKMFSPDILVILCEDMDMTEAKEIEVFLKDHFQENIPIIFKDKNDHEILRLSEETAIEIFTREL